MTSSLPFAPPPPELVAADVERAFAEDLGRGDATGQLLPADSRAGAPLVHSGVPLARHLPSTGLFHRASST